MRRLTAPKINCIYIHLAAAFPAEQHFGFVAVFLAGRTFDFIHFPIVIFSYFSFIIIFIFLIFCLLVCCLFIILVLFLLVLLFGPQEVCLMSVALLDGCPGLNV